MTEICDKCGESGEDRRTLWMACFYAMDELPIPFKQCAIRGKYMAQAGQKQLETLGLSVPVWGEPEGKEIDRPFYTLRVCKDCRADWMDMIQGWFQAPATKPAELRQRNIHSREWANPRSDRGRVQRAT